VPFSDCFLPGSKVGGPEIGAALRGPPSPIASAAYDRYSYDERL